MFVIVPGYAPLWPGLQGPIAWVIAASCTAVGLAAHRDTDRVAARTCLPTIADVDRTVFATSGQYAYRLPGIAELRPALLFGGALIAMLRGGATGAEAAAAVAGIISGLNAIRWCGYAFGTIITAAPQARIYRKFLAAVPSADSSSRSAT
jgi:hypothetical protein